MKFVIDSFGAEAGVSKVFDYRTATDQGNSWYSDPLELPAK